MSDFLAVGTVAVSAVSLAVTGDISTAVPAVALAIITVVSLAIIWRLETALRKGDQTVRQQERVSAAAPGLAAALADLSAATVALLEGSDGSPRSFVQHCEAACKDFAGALFALTGRHCRVTLQEVYVPEEGPDETLAVKIIASSYGAIPDRATEDLVDDNTDFRACRTERIYLCNDLPGEINKGYKNSHWTPELLAEWHRTGGYPYQATVVWPMRALVVSPSPDGKAAWDIAGFLSVDSVESGTFDRNTIEPLGEALAHTAYSGFRLYRALGEEDLWQD